MKLAHMVIAGVAAALSRERERASSLACASGAGAGEGSAAGSCPALLRPAARWRRSCRGGGRDLGQVISSTFSSLSSILRRVGCSFWRWQQGEAACWRLVIRLSPDTEGKGLAHQHFGGVLAAGEIARFRNLSKRRGRGSSRRGSDGGRRSVRALRCACARLWASQVWSRRGRCCGCAPGFCRPRTMSGSV